MLTLASVKEVKKKKQPYFMVTLSLFLKLNVPIQQSTISKCLVDLSVDSR